MSENAKKMIYMNESAVKATDMKGKLVCPGCGKALAFVYDDAAGFVNIKCNRCKRKTLFNLLTLTGTLIKKGKVENGCLENGYLAEETGISRVRCILCGFPVIYVYAGAKGHLNLWCKRKKCYNKLVVDLEKLSSALLNG